MQCWLSKCLVTILFFLKIFKNCLSLISNKSLIQWNVFLFKSSTHSDNNFSIFLNLTSAITHLRRTSCHNMLHWLIYFIWIFHSQLMEQFRTSTHIRTCLNTFHSTNYLHLLSQRNRSMWLFSDISTFTWLHYTSLTRHCGSYFSNLIHLYLIGLVGRWGWLSSLIGCAVFFISHSLCIVAHF